MSVASPCVCALVRIYPIQAGDLLWARDPPPGWGLPLLASSFVFLFSRDHWCVVSLQNVYYILKSSLSICQNIASKAPESKTEFSKANAVEVSEKLLRVSNQTDAKSFLTKSLGAEQVETWHAGRHTRTVFRHAYFEHSQNKKKDQRKQRECYFSILGDQSFFNRAK